MNYRSHWLIGFELKSRYQAAYLTSIGIVNGLILASMAVLIIWSGSGPDDTIAFQPGDQTLSGVLSEQLGSLPSGKSFGGPTDVRPSKWRGGHVGQIQIVRDYAVPVPSAPDVPYHHSANESELSSAVFFAGVDGEAGEGGYGYGEDDFGLPPDQPYMPQARLVYPAGVGEINAGPRIDRAAVMLIRQPAFPNIAKESDTVLVEILLTIDDDGCITWKVLREVPEGKGFASSVIRALMHSEYEPAVYRGQKVEQEVKLTFILCLTCRSSLDYSGNVEAAWLD